MPEPAESGRPLRADARRNRDKVLRAAREAFADTGYDVPLDEIAARAGVGPGTVYRHFPSKEALFEAVTAARVSDLVEEARAGAGSADPGAAFFAFLGRLSEEAAVKRDLPEAISVEGGLRDSMLNALGVLLDNAQRAGAVRPDVGTGDLIVLFKGMIRSVQEIPPGAAGNAQRERLFAVITDGLRPAGN